jgi:hypothetical protein
MPLRCRKPLLRAGHYYAGFYFTSFLYAFSIKLKNSHRIGVMVAFRQKFDRRRREAVRGEKWQASTLGVHGRNGGPGLYRVVIWLIFGEANKREEQEVEVSMCRM